MSIDLEKDAREQVPLVAGGALSVVSALAIEMLRLEAEAADFDEKAKKKRDAAREISTIKLPAAMEAAQLKEFTLMDGRKVEVSAVFDARITEETKPACYEWLRANKHGDIIKQAVAVAFDTSPAGRKHMKAVLSTLKKLKLPFEQKESVHAGTLKRVLREDNERGKPIPFALFSVFEGVRAVVKDGKKTVTHVTANARKKDQKPSNAKNTKPASKRSK